MKYVSYGTRSVLMTDDSADALIEYAAALGAENTADTVTLSAIGPEGIEVDVTFLLNPASTLIIESATGQTVAPENTEAVERLRARTRRLRQPPSAEPYDWDVDTPGPLADFD